MAPPNSVSPQDAWMAHPSIGIKTAGYPPISAPITSPPSQNAPAALPAGGSDAQSQEFRSAFQPQYDAINGHLGYTSAHAEAALHNPLAARRDALVPSFQAALSQVNPDDPNKAKGAIDSVLGKAQALNTEVAQFRATAEKAFNDWQSRQERFTEATQQVGELEAWGDPKAAALRGLVDGIGKLTEGRKFAQASQTFDQFEPKLKPIYDDYVRQKEAKAQYDPALEALQPRLSQACAAEHVKLKPKQDEIAPVQQAMETSAQAKNYVQAYQQVGELASKVEAYEAAVEELEQQKKAYEDAWAAAQDKVAQTEQARFKKLEPQQQEIAAAKAAIEDSASKEEYVEALNQVTEISKKADDYQAAAEELDRQKKAYEDAWAGVQPNYEKTCVSQFKKFEELQQELAKIKGEIDASVEAEDFEHALQLVNDLSGKVDSYLAAVEEAEKQRQEYEDAWSTVGPKFTETMQSTSKKLAPDRDAMTAQKEQIDKAVEAEDFVQALNATNELGTKADAYLEAAKVLEEQKQKYEEALAALQPELDEVAKSPSKSLQPMRDEIANIKGEMEKAAEAEEYEQASNHVQDLKTKVQQYKEDLKKEEEEYNQERERIESQMQEVSASNFAQLEPKKTPIMTGYQAMLKQAEEQDFKGATEAGRNLEVPIGDYLGEVKKLRESIKANLKAHLPQVEGDLKTLQDDKWTKKDQVNSLLSSVKAGASSDDDAVLEKAAKDDEELAKLVEEWKNDPCSKARRSPDYQKAMDDWAVAKSKSNEAAIKMQHAKKTARIKDVDPLAPDPRKLAEGDWAIKEAEAAHDTAIAEEMKAYKAVLAVLKTFGCNEQPK